MASETTHDASRALTGHHALVTGGSRGIGAACAAALVAEGARVTLLGRTAGTLAERAEALGGAVGWVAADVTDEGSVAAAVAAAREARGTIDILVNNAGGTASAPFHRTDRAAWDGALALNLTSLFTVTQAVLADMRRAGWGRVVNVASTAGQKGYAYVAAYCAAKHGVIGLTRALALEYARDGITVNAVCPGFTDTDMTRESVARIAETTGRSADQARQALESMNPQGRLVRPEDVAAAVAWLCRPEAGAVTGLALPVAGGEVMP
ncbi:MAG: SDR family oxidoreductase [Rhodobacterales bacterium]|nr:SDR family oxidoreductase [Rhodobacterales bacterium]